MIDPSDLPGLTETVARRVIAVAVGIAPCLHSLVDDEKSSALAILSSVGLGLSHDRPNPYIKQKTLGPKSIQYVTGVIESAFTADDRVALQAMCRATSDGYAGPVGNFPPPPRMLSRLWPEC